MGSAMSLVTGVLGVTWHTGFTSNHLVAKLGRGLCKKDMQGGCPAKTRLPPSVGTSAGDKNSIVGKRRM